MFREVAFVEFGHCAFKRDPASFDCLLHRVLEIRRREDTRRVV